MTDPTELDRLPPGSAGFLESWVKERDAYPDEQWQKLAAEAPTVDPAAMGTWQEVAAEYPPSGPAGITYMQATHHSGTPINCLLHWDDDGTLSGILTHYPVEIPGLQAANTFHIWTRPDRQRQGIGTLLTMAARGYGWRSDPTAYRLTPSGKRLLLRHERIRDEFRANTHSGQDDPQAGDAGAN